MFPTLPLSYLSVFLLMSSQVACAANQTIDTDDTSIQNTPKSQSLTLSEANREVNNEVDKAADKETNNEADDIEIIDPLTDLKNNQRKWQKSGIVSYDYEYIHQCLDCAPVKTHYMALTVKQNQLDPIYDQRTQAPLKSTQKGSLLIHTINDWFYLIEEKIQKNTDAFFSVEYYPISGQPRQLFLTDQQAKKSHYFFRAAIPLKVDYASTSINANHNNKAID